MLAKNRMKFFVYVARATKRGGARSAQSSLPGEPSKTPRFRRFLKSLLAKNRMKFFVYAAKATKRDGAQSAQSSLPGEPSKTPRFRRFQKSLLAKRTPIKKGALPIS